LTEDRDALRRIRAEAALVQWADFMSNRPADTIVFIWELTHGGGWRGNGADDAKSDFLSGRIEATVGLPTDAPTPGQVRWPDGTMQEVPLISASDALAAMIAELRGDQSAPECGDCLQVAGATLTTRTALTWRGEAQVPVWQFEFTGRGEPIEPISFVAVRDRVASNDWDGWPHFFPSTSAAYGLPDDTEITVLFSGGACDTSHSIAAVESNDAIVPIISTQSRGGTCTAQAVGYVLRLRLAAPLGERVVLDLDSGYPVPVYPQDPPDGVRPG
jgi:hypothetical protein